MSRASISERTPILAINNQPSHNSEHAAIGFVGALKIPGVVEFSLCLFFTKLVSYTFLFWLPMYITSSSKYDFRNKCIDIQSHHAHLQPTWDQRAVPNWPPFSIMAA